jgi:hypothetical protein
MLVTVIPHTAGKLESTRWQRRSQPHCSADGGDRTHTLLPVLDFESSASAIPPRRRVGRSEEYELRIEAQMLPTKSSGCKLRGGPKISRKIIASRKPDVDPSNAAMSILVSGDLVIGWVANA